MKKTVTPSEIAKIYNLSTRQVQRKVSKAYLDEDNGKIIKDKNGRFFIDKSIVHQFKPTYKTTKNNPNENTVIGEDWDLFCDFVPIENTPAEVLKAIMYDLFNYLKRKLKRPITLYYSIEAQPKAGMHVHFFINAEYYLPKLLDIVNERIEILSLSNQYHDYFRNEIKMQATSYLSKGKKVNYKNAEFIFAELLMSGRRGGYNSVPWIRGHK
jgi:transcriptional antiterminator